MKPSDRINRRQMIATGATVAAITIVPRHVLGGLGHSPPSQKLNIAGVGVGGQGGWDLGQLSGENVVALADDDWGYAARTFGKYPRAPKYKDFREMLDKEIRFCRPPHRSRVAGHDLRPHGWTETPLGHGELEVHQLERRQRADQSSVPQRLEPVASGRRLLSRPPKPG
jgi:hypothetical protein